ncbi:hypothetical protein QZH41_004042 [Actinostola sp. cb2023]|nr:hypothetical protein QZH41_004042 [Actinostola sp. cb2023]
MRYTLEVNGRVVTRLPSNKHNFTMKRCKPGMKYTCYLVVMTTAGGAGGKQNKKNEGKAKKVVTAVSTNEFDSDDEESSSFQEASDESDDGCVVLEWRSSTPLKGVSSYRVHWRSSLEDQGEMEDHLSPSCTSYEVYPVKQRYGKKDG